MRGRTIGAVAAGGLAFETMVLLLLLAARSGWPAYRAAEVAQDFGVAVLVARLAAGSLATLTGGAIAAHLGTIEHRAALLFGVILLTVSAAWHFVIWTKYPVWYHFGWLGCIVPSALLGEHFVRLGAWR